MLGQAFLVLVALAGSAHASCLHATSLMPRQEGKVQISDFTYSGETGPLNWAGIKADNIACRTATVQSPIVIDDTIPFASEIPQIVINPVNEAEFENLGTTLETIVEGSTTFGGAEFTLKQFHLHSPSEHRINEEYFPLEMHMVHEGPDGSIAVIAVMFQLSEDGSTTELLNAVTENLADVQTPGTATKTGSLDFSALIQAIQGQKLFQYTGSLTTPPCKEGLTFLVTSKPLPLDVKTFNALKSTLKFNARYSQNTLGKTNLLAVAAELAVREGDFTTQGIGAAVTNGTAVDAHGNSATVNASGNVDVIALVQELVAQNKALKFETVTTTTTNVVLADKTTEAHSEGATAGDKAIDGAGAEASNDGEPIAAVEIPGKPLKTAVTVPEVASSPAEGEQDVHLVKIYRSRIGRGLPRRDNSVVKRRL